jgi:hypothetical protein
MKFTIDLRKYKGLLLYEDGGKASLHKRRISNVFIFLVVGFIILNSVLEKKPDTSSVETRYKSKELTHKPQTKQKKVVTFGTGIPVDETSSSSHSKTRKKRRKNIKLKAKQVMLNGNNKSGKLPLGTSAVGELLTTIDSRDVNQIVRVRLPYGLKLKGQTIIPKDSLLLGKASYLQGHERIFVSFFATIDKTGFEAPISAQALDSKDFATGLIGNVHSNKGLKIAGSVALNVISGAAGFVQDRSSGVNGVDVPTFNAENALLSGAGGTARNEANTLSNSIRSTKDYITVDAGSELIVMLTQTYKGDQR